MLLQQFVCLVVPLVLLFQVFIVGANRIKCTKENQKFQCENKRCIVYRFVCDGDDDCGDSSDELHCSTKKCNETLQYRCNNAICIPKQWLCDGQNDCRDNSDESYQLCSTLECKSNEFKCGTKCIAVSWKCDGEEDCDDGSDEDNCPESTCLSTEFKCKTDKECIAHKWVCDGENDCKDASDEVGCGGVTCQTSDFKCATQNQCISQTWVCDRDEDCEDNSDEKNCSYSVPQRCASGFFACHSQDKCILQAFVCDGDFDCGDHSDEKNCSTRAHSCSRSEFSCSSKHCIDKSKVCDGENDCSDGSDEFDCQGTNACNNKTHFTCQKGGKCILLSQLCDRHNDCPDGEDEMSGVGKCNVNECRDYNGNCTHNCIDLPFGRKCTCRRGFQVNKDDETLCDDINECANKDEKACTDTLQTCINLKGSFKCICPNGYRLDKGLCKPLNSSISRPGISILLCDRVSIRRININGGEYMSLVTSGLKHAVGIALHSSQNLVYWTDVKKETISSTSLESGSTPRKMKGSRSPWGLAIDWVNDLLYWTDISLHTVSVSDLQLTMSSTIVSMEDSAPLFIAVHPELGYMFVSEIGKNSTSILRLGMDGSDRTEIISNNIKLPSGLTIDYDTNRLYWLDAKLHQLSSCNLNGENRRTVLDVFQHLQRPFGIALFINRVYWTDQASHSLRSCDKLHGNKIEVIDSQIRAPMDIRIDHHNNQPQFTKRCLNHNCEHFCLPTPSTSRQLYVCACPDGFISSTHNSSRCVKDQSTTTASIVTSQANTAQGATPIWLIIVLVCTVLVASLFIFRWWRNRNSPLSMNFDNPVYSKTTTNDPNHPQGREETNTFVSIPHSESRQNLVGDDETDDISDWPPSKIPNITKKQNVYAPLESEPNDFDTDSTHNLFSPDSNESNSVGT